MKRKHSTLVSNVEDLQQSVVNHPSLLLGGAGLSARNRVIFTRALESWLFLIEDLMLRQGVSDEGRLSRMQNFAFALQSTDILDVLLSFDKIYYILITDAVSSPDTFKQYLKEELSDDIDFGRLLSPINQCIYSFLTETNKKTKAHFLSSIAQFLRFPRKLEFEALGLEDQALRDYIEIENELDTMVNDDETIYNGLSDVIKEWFGDFHIENLRPNHGSGSVAEGPLTLAEKFKNVKTDKTLEVLLRNHSFPSSFEDYFPLQPGTGLERISRTIFVPKTATKLRTISMEPIALQYIQQGVMYELYRFIETHPYLGMRVVLGDQTQNQVLALEGSMNHSYGTIDLSHASDSVSWALVRRIFYAVPHLYKWLLGTRSSSTLLPNGERISLKKFAPMGSALCFPIECIIFSAIVEYASRNVCIQTRSTQKLWSVYGDDIVVQSECYEEVIRLLQFCGFTVNVSKSYNAGEYRESCGKEYYAGIDITPVYYRTSFYNRKVSPSAYGSWCSAANNAYFHRLPVYREYLITKILSTQTLYGPYFSVCPEASPHIYSPQPTNFHVGDWWNRDYQRVEGRFISVLSKPRDGEPGDDRLAYFIKLVEMSKRSTGSVTRLDESKSSYAMHGCVEFFSSTAQPVTPFWRPSRTLASDWQGT